MNMSVDIETLNNPETLWATETVYRADLFKGKVALINVPQIGIMDAAMAIEARGDLTYVAKGNMTKDETDTTIAVLAARKKEGTFRASRPAFR